MRELLLRVIWFFLLALMLMAMPLVYVVTAFAGWAKQTADTLDIELVMARVARKTAEERRQRGGK